MSLPLNVDLSIAKHENDHLKVRVQQLTNHVVEYEAEVRRLKTELNKAITTLDEINYEKQGEKNRWKNFEEDKPSTPGDYLVKNYDGEISVRWWTGQEWQEPEEWAELPE